MSLMSNPVCLIINPMSLISNPVYLVSNSKFCTFLLFSILAPIPWFYTAELFDLPSSKWAISIAIVVNWTCNFTVGVAFPFMLVCTVRAKKHIWSRLSVVGTITVVDNHTITLVEMTSNSSTHLLYFRFVPH